MARNPVQFQKGISLNAVPLALWNRTAVLRRPVPMAMAQGVSVPALWPRPMLPTQQPQAPTVQSLPPPDLDHRRNHLRLHQAAPHGVVSGHLPHDPGTRKGSRR